MTFEMFKETVKEGLASGEIVITAPTGASADELTSELSLALQYAIGEEMRLKGTTLTVTGEDLAFLILKHCGGEVFSRVLFN